MSDKTESSGILTMSSSSGSSVDVEFQMMTSFSSGSTFYYSRLTFEVEASNTKTPTASPTKAPTVSPTKAPTVTFRSDTPTESPYQNDDMDDDYDDDDEESSFDSSSSSDSLDEDETSDDEGKNGEGDEENYSDYSMSESSNQDEDSESIHDKDEIEAAIVDGENVKNESTDTREDVSGELDVGDGSFLRGNTNPSSTSFVNNAYGGAGILAVIMNIFAL